METDHIVALNYQGHQMRVALVDGAPWWVVADVCRALGHRNGATFVRDLPAEHRRMVPVSPQHRGRVVSGEGLRLLLTASRKDGALRLLRWAEASSADLRRADQLVPYEFDGVPVRVVRRWVTHEVLPQIRRTGSYVVPGARQALSPGEAVAQIMDGVQRIHVNLSDGRLTLGLELGDGTVSIPGLPPELEDLLQRTSALQRENTALRAALKEIL
jgi:prophage antirepressor-like protein